MFSLNDELLKAITNLPEDSTIDDLMCRLYVINKIKKSQEAVIEVKVKTLEELKKEVLKMIIWTDPAIWRSLKISRNKNLLF